MKRHAARATIGLRDLALCAVLFTLAVPLFLAAAVPSHTALVVPLGMVLPFLSMTLVEEALQRRTEPQA